MAHIIGISGSLRKASYNSGLLRAAVQAAPAGSQIVTASIRDFPLYNGDIGQNEGVPAAVTDLKDLIASADGLLLASPEYNNSVPGVMKNAIDWLTRPSDDIARVFGGKPVAVMGAPPGGFGTMLGQSAWLPVFRTLRADFWAGGRLMVSRAGGLFSEDGELTDEKTLGQVRSYVRDFAAFCEKRRSG